MRKKWIALIMAIICFLGENSLLVFAGEIQPSGATIILNGQPIIFDVPPMIQDGRTLVPMRAIFELLGAEVKWNGGTQTVVATKEDTSILLRINQSEAVVNDETTSLDVPPTLYEGRTLVPLRFISEKLNLDVAFEEESNRIIISSKENNEPAGLVPDYIFDNGYYYKGALKNGERHGYGIVYQSNGLLSYAGDFVEGVPHGNGIEYRDDGTKWYAGVYVNGQINGEGVLYEEDGITAYYYGSVRDGKPDGKGLMYNNNGLSFEGEFVGGQLNGIYIVRDIDENVIGGVEFKDNEFVRTINLVAVPIDGSSTVSEKTKEDIEYEERLKRIEDEMFGSGRHLQGNGSQSGSYQSSTVNIDIVFNTAKYPLHLMANDGKNTYLGKLVTNKYDNDSIYNTYGNYGSKYSKTSIFNTYGDYGSNYSQYSPNNKYASNPPMIVDDNGKIIGYLTTNTYHINAISLETLAFQLKKHNQ